MHSHVATWRRIPCTEQALKILGPFVLLRAASAKKLSRCDKIAGQNFQASRLFHNPDCCSYLTSDSVYANTVPVAAW